MTANALAPSPRPRRRSTNAQAAARATARHRLDVYAVSAAEVICCAGGWLADRALAGWDVNVFLPGDDDATALRILGVSVHSLTGPGDAVREAQQPTAVAVSVDVITSDAGIRARWDTEFARDIAEVTLWGAAIPGDIGERFRSVQHIPSAAASAFKSYALRAAGIREQVPTAEVFHAGAGREERPRLAAVGSTLREALPAAAVWAPMPARAH